MNDGSPLPYLDAMERLRALLHAYSPLVVAFSGGLDSRFLTHTAGLWAFEGIRVHLLHCTGPHVPETETRAAVLWAEGRGLPLTLVAVDPLAISAVRGNAKDRCYHCKHHLFSTLLDIARTSPLVPQGATLCDGTNADDCTAYRPGLRALQELAIRSPLAEAGLGKAMLRSLGAATGLDNPGQAARPCLLTRFAYDTPAEPNVLTALGAAEETVDRLLAAWAVETGQEAQPEFRLRLTGLEAANRLEMDAACLPSAYHAELHVGAGLDAAWQQRLSQAVGEAGFRVPVVRNVDSVHGYYDQTS